jgi:hypothetical protein
MHRPRYIVPAAFAQERDAAYAVRLFSSASDAEVRYTLRRVIGEDGSLQMVVLEATCFDQRLVSRIETAMEGAHGMLVPTEALAAAQAN